MKKLLAVVMLMLSMVGISEARLITTPDGVLSMTLHDGQLQEQDLGGGSKLYKAFNADSTEATSLMEVFDPTGTPERNTTQAIVDSVIATAKNATLLSNVAGTYNGYKGREFVFTSTNDIGTSVVTTARVWVSGTATTLYAVMVAQPTNARNDSQAQWFLNTAVFHAENFR